MVAAPASLASVSEAKEVPDRLMNRSVKFTRPSSSPKGGVKMSLTSDVTMSLKAMPKMRPTARSRTFPRKTNFLNSFHRFFSVSTPHRIVVLPARMPILYRVHEFVDVALFHPNQGRHILC